MSQIDQNIKFSVITVCYNSEKTIQRTLQSIKDQTYKNIEYIVIDGGSTDKTLEIISNYKAIVDILISEPDNGIYDAMNKGIKLATGDYIGFLNSDDYYTNDIFEEYSIYLNQFDYDYIYSNTYFFRSSQKDYIKAENRLTSRVYQYMPMAHMSLFVKSYYIKYIKFNTNLGIAADLDFFNKLIKETSNYAFINKGLCYFSTEGISSIAKIKTLKESRRVALNNGKNYILTNMHFIYKLLRIYLYLLAGNTKIYSHIKKYFLKIKYKSKV